MVDKKSELAAMERSKETESASSRLEMSSPGSEVNVAGDIFVSAQTAYAVVHRMTHSIVRSETAIRQLSAEILDLLKQTGQADDITLLPEYFLKINGSDTSPLLMLIRQDEQLVAALYGRERRVLGIRTGMLQFGDYYGEGALISKENFKAAAIAYGALNVLRIPWFHSVRASFKVSDPNQISTIKSTIDATELKARMMEEAVQHILPLKSTFDAFLGTLGSHTRRNLRVYRRRTEQKGWKYVPQLSSEEAADAFKVLGRQQGKHKSSTNYLNCCQATFKAVPGSIYSGIRSDTGEWVSLAGGWVRNDQYFMLVQLNDNRHSRESISTVMRSYLIEELINSGIRKLNFVGGCSELLRNFCTPQSCTHYLFEKRGPMSAVREFIAPRLFRTSMASRIVRGSASGPGEIEHGAGINPSAKAPGDLG